MLNGYTLQLLSIVFNSFSVLFNKFSLLKLPISTVTICNIVLSIILCGSFYKDIKGYFTPSTLKVTFPISIINAVGVITLIYSIHHLSPISFAFLNRFYVVFAVLLAVTLLKERFTLQQGILIVLSIIGALCFTSRGEFGALNIFYTSTCLISAFCFALSSTMIMLSPIKLNTRIFYFYNNAIGLIPTLLYFLYFTETQLLMPNPLEIIFLSIATIGFFASMMFSFKSYESIPFGVSNALRSFSPIVLCLISLPFFPEKLSTLNIIGALLIMVPLAFLGLKKAEKNHDILIN